MAANIFEGIFSLRLVIADFYLEKPTFGLDPCYSEFRGKEIKRVPIIRIFGSNANGQKTCMHVHGVFPYLYIPYESKDFETVHKAMYQIASSIDKAINISLGQGNSAAQHVFKVQLVKGIPFYGYHRGEHQYLKIYMFNPRFVRRAANLLQNGAILGKTFHPHESHVPYILQFMIDYNLYGMSFLHVPLEIVKFRKNEEEDVLQYSGISSAQILSPTLVKKQSTSALDVDINSNFILNRFQLITKNNDNSKHSNPGVEAIWQDEFLRRRKLMESLTDETFRLQAIPPLEIPTTQERPNVKLAESDIFYRTGLIRKLLTLEHTLSGSGNSDQTLNTTIQINANETLMPTHPNMNAKEKRRTFNLKKLLVNAVYPEECTQDNNIANASCIENHLSRNETQNKQINTQKISQHSSGSSDNNLLLKKQPQEHLDDTLVDEQLVLSLTQPQVLLDTTLRPEDMELLDILQQLEEHNDNENQIDLDSTLAPLSQKNEKFEISPEQLDKSTAASALNEVTSDDDNDELVNDSNDNIHDFSIAMDDIDDILLKLTQTTRSQEKPSTSAMEKISQIDGSDDLLGTPKRRNANLCKQQVTTPTRTPTTPRRRTLVTGIGTSPTRSPRTPKSKAAAKYAALPLVFSNKSEKKNSANITSEIARITIQRRFSLDDANKFGLKKCRVLICNDKCPTEPRSKTNAFVAELRKPTEKQHEEMKATTESTNANPRVTRRSKRLVDHDKTYREISCSLRPIKNKKDNELHLQKVTKTVKNIENVKVQNEENLCNANENNNNMKIKTKVIETKAENISKNPKNTKSAKVVQTNFTTNVQLETTIKANKTAIKSNEETQNKNTRSLRSRKIQVEISNETVKKNSDTHSGHEKEKQETLPLNKVNNAKNIEVTKSENSYHEIANQHTPSKDTNVDDETTTNMQIEDVNLKIKATKDNTTIKMQQPLNKIAKEENQELTDFLEVFPEEEEELVLETLLNLEKTLEIKTIKQQDVNLPKTINLNAINECKTTKSQLETNKTIYIANSNNSITKNVSKDIQKTTTATATKITIATTAATTTATTKATDQLNGKPQMSNSKANAFFLPTTTKKSASIKSKKALENDIVQKSIEEFLASKADEIKALELKCKEIAKNSKKKHIKIPKVTGKIRPKLNLNNIKIKSFNIVTDTQAWDEQLNNRNENEQEIVKFKYTMEELEKEAESIEKMKQNVLKKPNEIMANEELPECSKNIAVAHKTAVETAIVANDCKIQATQSHFVGNVKSETLTNVKIMNDKSIEKPNNNAAVIVDATNNVAAVVVDATNNVAAVIDVDDDDDDEQIQASDNETETLNKSIKKRRSSLKRLRRSFRASLTPGQHHHAKRVKKESDLNISKTKTENIEQQQPQLIENEQNITKISKTPKNINKLSLREISKCSNSMLIGSNSPSVFSDTSSPAHHPFSDTPPKYLPDLCAPVVGKINDDDIVSITPLEAPPTYFDVLEDCEKFGIYEHEYQKPFYSNSEDITKPKELGYTVLHIPGNKVSDLPEFESTLRGVIENFMGLNAWRRKKIVEIGGPEMLNRYRTTERIRDYLASQKRICITPSISAPTPHDAKVWLKARELLQIDSEQQQEQLLAQNDEKRFEIDSPIKIRRQKVTMMFNDETNSGNQVDDNDDIDCTRCSLSLTPMTPATPLSCTQFKRRKFQNDTQTPVTTNSLNQSKTISSNKTKRCSKRGKLSLSAKLNDAVEAAPKIKCVAAEKLLKKTDANCDSDVKTSQESTDGDGDSISLKSSQTSDSHVSSQSVIKELERSSFVRNLRSVSTDGGGHDMSFGISHATLDNTFGFKVNLENLQQAKSDVEYNYLTTIVLELFIPTRGTLYPNPEFDEIRCMFYAIENSIPTTSTDNLTQQLPAKACGYIIVSDANDLFTEGKRHGIDADIEVKIVATEIDAIQALLELCAHWDADIYAGYEIEMLSWGYLIERSKYLCFNIIPLLSRVPTQKARNFVDEDKDHYTDLDVEMKLCGRILLDVWRLMRSEIALTSYTFENVMYHILHKRCPAHKFHDLTAWFQSPCSRWIVIEYYLERVRGNLAILEQLDLLGRTSEMAKLIGIQFYEVLSRGSQFRVESMMLRIAKPKNLVPLSPSVQQRAHMRAPEYLPLILEPESRFYVDPVIVLDFQSLYPSVIIGYNYCFSTCLGRVEHLGHETPFEFGASQLRVSPQMLRKLIDRDLINISPCGVVFVKSSVREGILPRMLTEILNTRLMVKQSMKLHKSSTALQRILHSRQLGLKLMANVTYGYTAANFSGRMPAVEVGDSVVAKGREALETAIKMVQSNDKWQAKVVYGDTDSLFVMVPGRSREEAFKIGEEIAEAVTQINPHPMKLKLEKVYQPCILQTKKRYVGYMYESADQSAPIYEAKGIETVRRDGCPAVAKMLEKVLRILFETRDVSLVKKYVCRQFTKLLSGRANLQDLIFAKEFRGLNGYKPTACVPALELTRRWIQTDPRRIPRCGERVPFIVTNGPPGVPLIRLVRSPYDVIDDEGLNINAIYYITKAIIGPLNRCLLLIGADVNEWFSNLPRKILINPALSIGNELIGRPQGHLKKSTISQYFSTTKCIIDCGRQTKQGICAACMQNATKVFVTLNAKIGKLERNYHLTQQMCQACAGRIGDISCASLDCPAFYVLEEQRRKSKQIEHFQKLLEEKF